MLFRASMPHNSEILFCHTIPLWSHYSGAIWSRYLAASMSHNFTYTLLCNTNSIPKISCHKKVADQSRSQSLVPLDQRSKNESSGSNHFEITMEITEFWTEWSTIQEVIEQVISKSFKGKARGRFEIMSAITP